ncbi:LysM peptidoglycan-binding domain-containing protein [Gordonia amarae]|uniref:LysM domain-containing protein n=2 Tax=Gordonia amarae TaxID=36821 RepID=G7GVS3_9ACTN|nr:LysM peptidoglycan-binding domain-containing protein [Gordonia amarae]MCS3878776.1 hypothetical protein [Gordonia amarae]QHN17351.1 LysM peptidoglycan-binding domain-containing protein [Gordonia amarae]QHN21877.1 LysM peptidoglycan-binding domain-containing protein [Gordonia amarae]QHN30727.1 LysM peptidoglycan-binding domain-containing protein [Gordonia amarae]QHN39503.1 LysM peptidoglycan-binding domain-containing protein [Gordonia amarae]
MATTFAEHARRAAPTHDRIAPRRPAGNHGTAARRVAPRTPVPAGTRCAARGHDPREIASWETIARRRSVASAVLAGALLAVVTWLLVIVGNNYADAVAPDPTGSALVHVRSNESLSSVAARVAPGYPVEAVVEQIRELNDLTSSGLVPGQPLVVPRYR